MAQTQVDSAGLLMLWPQSNIKTFSTETEIQLNSLVGSQYGEREGYKLDIDQCG